MSSTSKPSLRAQYDEQQTKSTETRLEALLDQITSAAHTINVCALNLQSAEAVHRRNRIWLAVGFCTGLALATLVGPYWPW